MLRLFLVEENKNHRCIVCKAEFLTRIERNDHLETHFVHRNCEHCSKPVIIIGDLEFELHRPTHCDSTIETIPAPTTAIPDDDNFADDRTLAIEFLDDTDDKYDIKTLVGNLESPRMTKRSKPKVNYNENDEIVNITTNKREKSQRKSKKSNVCRASAPHKTEHIEIDANLDFVSNDDFNSCTISKSNSESEDDVVKEMDVALKKRQRKYNRLPKTVPCTMCDMMFGTERTLKIHMNQVHGIKEKYICPICTREFKNGGNLKQHIETHSDYKRFICNYCGKGFHLPYNLKEHMNTHTGARYDSNQINLTHCKFEKVNFQLKLY